MEARRACVHMPRLEHKDCLKTPSLLQAVHKYGGIPVEELMRDKVLTSVTATRNGAPLLRTTCPQRKPAAVPGEA